MGKCIICGKEFIPYHGSKDQITCSVECRLEKKRIRHREWYNSNVELHRSEQRAYQRKHFNGRIKCIICGEPVFRMWDDPLCSKNARMHDGCVYDDIIATLAAGITLSTKQRSRLSARGYNQGTFMKDFKEEILDETYKAKVADKRGKGAE